MIACCCSSQTASPTVDKLAGLPLMQAIQDVDDLAVINANLEGTIHDAFMVFHKENPHVYELFVRFARELMKAGKRKGSSKLIIERMRWEMIIQTRDVDFKLNNNYTSRYARLAMAEERDLRDFFEIRALRNRPHSETRPWSIVKEELP